MKILRKLWDYYSVKLILVFVITSLLSMLHLYRINGAFVLICTILIFVHSFKDPAFKKKHIITRTTIYIFMIIFCVSGFLVMLQGKNAGNFVHQQISSSDVFE